MIQTSSILPYFKEQGWYVVVNTVTRGFDVIQNDPHIDEVFVQENKQITNDDLPGYWAKLSENFTKFVNLSGSIEGKLLAIPGKPQHRLRKKTLHWRMNKDYFKQMHNIAGADMPCLPKFYPTDKEEKEAEAFCAETGGFIILWVLSGSSIHKSYPYADSVIARLLIDYPSVRIVFVGEELCKLLEEPWKNEKRIIRRSGGDIRKSLALSQKVDMVVSPETGVANCVAYEDVPKILFLSHSSPKNWGAKFINTTLMVPQGVKCYPCHKIHYGWATCNRDKETGGAMCQASIDPAKVYKAIAENIERRKAV